MSHATFVKSRTNFDFCILEFRMRQFSLKNHASSCRAHKRRATRATLQIVCAMMSVANQHDNSVDISDKELYNQILAEVRVKPVMKYRSVLMIIAFCR
jgi:hypothetical protein